MARAPYTRINFRNEKIYQTQVDTLDFLEPGWLMLKASAIHQNTRAAMVKKGWIEVRVYRWGLLARLTPAGREVRDALEKRRAGTLARNTGME